jgi:type I restriction enzyme S subunit
LSSKRSCDLRFITEFINNSVDFAIESTGVPQLTEPQISKYPVALPPTKAEQTGIAGVLSDIDSEIVALEAKLTKVRDLKQGMMQELLTGTIRLV